MSSTTDLYDSIARQAIPGYAPAPKPAPADFALRNLSTLAYAHGFTHWHYRAYDLTSVRSPGYFAPAADLVKPGDMLTATTSGGDALQAVFAADGSVRVMMATEAAP